MNTVYNIKKNNNIKGENPNPNKNNTTKTSNNNTTKTSNNNTTETSNNKNNPSKTSIIKEYTGKNPFLKKYKPFTTSSNEKPEPPKTSRINGYLKYFPKKNPTVISLNKNQTSSNTLSNTTNNKSNTNIRTPSNTLSARKTNILTTNVQNNKNNINRIYLTVKNNKLNKVTPELDTNTIYYYTGQLRIGKDEKIYNRFCLGTFIEKKKYEANSTKYKYVFEAHNTKSLNEIISDKNIGNVFFYDQDKPETL